MVKNVHNTPFTAQSYYDNYDCEGQHQEGSANCSGRKLEN